VRGENVASNVVRNPAGLIASLRVEYEGGEGVIVLSDSDWKCANTETAGWNRYDFDDTAWANAMALADYGSGPWGTIHEDLGPYMRPYSAGVADGVRVVYLPAAKTVTMAHLKGGAQYSAYAWDPSTGKKTPLGDVQADANGVCRVPPPIAAGTDWLLVLRPRPR
jgi:hypothetical protein